MLVGMIPSRSFQWYVIGTFMMPFEPLILTPKLGSQTDFRRPNFDKVKNSYSSNTPTLENSFSQSLKFLGVYRYPMESP